jgi:putative PEP-CTERM system TPR-repeat lipoprotein
VRICSSAAGKALKGYRQAWLTLDSNYYRVFFCIVPGNPFLDTRRLTEVYSVIFKSLMITVLTLGVISGCGGKTKEELYAEGLKQIKNSNPNSAIVLLKSALEKDKNYFDARFQLGKAYTAVGKFEQATKEYQWLMERNPANPELKLELARLYVFIGKPELALKGAQEFAATHPDSPDALEIMGLASVGLNRLPDGESYLQRTLQVEPARLSAKLELAAVYLKRDKESEARKLLDEAIQANPNNTRPYQMLAVLEASKKDIDKALAVYAKIIAINPADRGAMYRSGMLYLEKNDLNSADKLADELVKKYPGKPEGHRLKGIVNFTKKNYREAIAELQESLKQQPNNEAWYFLGLSFYSTGELETALNQFRKILDSNPSFHRARLLSAMILLRQRRADEAIVELKRVLADDPQNPLAHSFLGSAYTAKGMVEEGMKEFNRTIELDPKVVEVYLKKGLVHLNRGKEKDAEADLNTALQVAPDLLDSRLMLAAFYLRQNNQAKAVEVLKQGLNGKKTDAAIYNYLAAVLFGQDKGPEGLQQLLKSKESDAEFLPAYFNAAMYYFAKGEKEKAIAEYQGILKKDPKNIAALLNLAELQELMGRDKESFECYLKAKETKSEIAYLALANYHLKKKQTKKALAVLDEGIKELPRTISLLEVKGRIYQSEKNLAEAVKVYNDIESLNQDKGVSLKIGAFIGVKDFGKAEEQARRYISLNPKGAFGHMLLATVYENRNDMNAAINEVRNGLKGDKDNLQALLMLGNLYTRKKEYSAALATYGEALQKDPGFVQALCAQGQIHDVNGNKKEAIKKYREVLAKSDSYVPALNNLAYLYVDGYGSPQEGLRLALSGFKQDPNNPAIIDTLGYALLKNGRKDEAVRHLEKAVTLLPNDPTVAYHLGLAYRESGKREQAAKSFATALTLGEFAEAATARKLLNELKK